MTQASAKGRLYLVPTPLDFGCDVQVALDEVLARDVLRTAARLSHWITENAKTTRAFLKRVDAAEPLATPVQAQQLVELPRAVHKKGDHGSSGAAFDTTPLLAPALAGHDMGLVSEAGMPAVADPGSSVVRAAHDLGIEVIALPGPVSVLLALAASGLGGQNFAFVGYLPQDVAARGRRIAELEQLALRQDQTQLFIETPYRNAALFRALVQALQAHTRLSISTGLTLPQARTVSAPVKAWKRWLQEAGNAPALPAQAPDNQTPAVFAIGR